LLRLPQNDETGAGAYHRLRRLARQHPALLLAQLGAVSALLQCRPDLSPGDFLEEGHLGLFVRILGVLEALKPTVYSQPEGLPGLVGLLLAPLDAAAGAKAGSMVVGHMAPLAGQSGVFLASLAQEVPAQLRGLTLVLQRCAAVWPEATGLAEAARKSASRLPCGTKRPNGEATERLLADARRILTAPGVGEGRSAWRGAVQDFVCGELEEACRKSPREILPRLIEELLALTGGESPVMPQAYDKLVQALYLDSSPAERVGQVLLANLRSPREDVRAAAIGAAGDIFPYAQRAQRREVLACLFEVGEPAIAVLRRVLAAESVQ